MIKRILIILFSSFLGIIGNPEFLTASDSVFLSGLNEEKIVETVALPEPETTEMSSEAEVAYEDTYYEPAYYDYYEEEYYEEPVYEPYTANYNVTYHVGSKDEFNAIAYSLSYYDIYKYKNMLYGHNSWNLLGNLTERYIGEIITITDGGVTRSYRVSDIAVYEKTADGNLEWDSKLMGRIANGMGHSISLFTCYGTSYGNGDASHRYVVFADAI